MRGGARPSTQGVLRKAAADSWTMHPDGFLIRGMNLVPRPTGGWPEFWITAWDWAGWVQPQIDAAARAGANTIRGIGTSWAVINNMTDQATLDSHVRQVVEYVLSKGMAYYPTLGSDFLSYGTTPTITQVTDAAHAAAVNLVQYQSRFVGCDMAQEVGFTWAQGVSSGQTASNGELLKAAVRSGGLTVPTTTSNVFDARWCDYNDTHIYTNSNPATYFQSFWNGFPGVKVIIGESGVNAAESGAIRAARPTDISRIVRALGPAGQHCAGALYWAAYDQDSATGNKWGLYDGPTANTERADALALFRSWPTVWGS